MTMHAFIHHGVKSSTGCFKLMLSRMIADAIKMVELMVFVLFVWRSSEMPSLRSLPHTRHGAPVQTLKRPPHAPRTAHLGHQQIFGTGGTPGTHTALPHTWVTPGHHTRHGHQFAVPIHGALICCLVATPVARKRW